MSGLHPSGCCSNCRIRVQLFLYPPFLRTARAGVLVWRVSQDVRLSCTMMSSTHSRCCPSSSPCPSILPSFLPLPSLLTWTKGTELYWKTQRLTVFLLPASPGLPSMATPCSLLHSLFLFEILLSFSNQRPDRWVQLLISRWENI